MYPFGESGVPNRKIRFTRFPGQTHQKNLYKFCILFSEYLFVILTQISQISQRTHRYTRVCHPAENTRQCRQARAKRRAFCEICEICVRLNHLCEGILVRLPCPIPDKPTVLQSIEIRLRLRTEGRWPKGKANAQINLAFHSACIAFSLLSQTEDRRRLGNAQINLAFHSACTIFVT